MMGFWAGVGVGLIFAAVVWIVDAVMEPREVVAELPHDDAADEAFRTAIKDRPFVAEVLSDEPVVLYTMDPVADAEIGALVDYGPARMYGRLREAPTAPPRLHVVGEQRAPGDAS